MAIIYGPDGYPLAILSTNAAKVALADPSGNPYNSGNPLPTTAVANLSGDDADLDSGAGSDPHDVLAIGIPFAGGHKILTGADLGGGIIARHVADTQLIAQMATLLTQTDGLEGLATALNGYTDQVEGKLDTLHTDLQNVGIYTDGLEGLLTTLLGQTDGVEASLTSILAKILAAPATEAKQDTIITALASLLAALQPAGKIQTATGAAAAAVTCTIPAPGAGLFNYLSWLEIIAYSTVARVGGVTPVVVTSTQLNSAAWTFASAAAVGTSERQANQLERPLRADTAATAVTIVCPATASVIWRVNAAYHVAA